MYINIFTQSLICTSVLTIFLCYLSLEDFSLIWYFEKVA